MNRSLPFLAACALSTAFAVLLPGSVSTAMAETSCGQAVIDTQAAVDRLIADLAASGPVAPESGAIMDGEEPTPESMARIEGEIGDGLAPDKALAALDRARKADDAGDDAACLKEVAAARDAIGLE